LTNPVKAVEARIGELATLGLLDKGTRRLDMVAMGTGFGDNDMVAIDLPNHHAGCSRQRRGLLVSWTLRCRVVEEGLVSFVLGHATRETKRHVRDGDAKSGRSRDANKT
jgi:hypothetical protein